ncbi:sensor histidine kinase [Desertivirga arenae]|uniref:sensor histidine kinase n=1 Tax=Desertivirga arenae TaxID=2810309 RepID=UPI001A97B12F|nr:HAMP domain-containing sensor histidine kinase [Pedobacter sp. SYSU D00823]
MKDIVGSRFRYRWILATVILLSSMALIAFNYYSIKLLASVRALRNAQFVYVKAQKSAIRGLSVFVYNQRSEYYEIFKSNISIPIADSLARTGWEKGKSHDFVKKAYLKGQNYPHDLGDILWLFQNFSQLNYFKTGFHYWRSSDYYVGQLWILGEKIHRESTTHQFSIQKKEIFTKAINQVCRNLDGTEEKFSEMLVNISNSVSRWLLILNIIFILLVFLNVGLFFNKLMKQLKDALQQIEAQNKAKEEFLSVASHELKSPITFMKASIQILERFAKNTPETKKIHPFIVNSGKQVDRLNNLVKELLDVTKIQSGRLTLNKEEFDIDALIQEAVEEKKQLHTHFLLIKSLASAKVYADPNRIYQVLENLLSNAMKYSQSETEIVVWSEIQGDKIKVCIKDEGKGIPEENQAMLFDRYYRVESTQHTVQGLGLGLYICSEIIKSHDGKIGVESKSAEGSTFWFCLPLLKAESKIEIPIGK